eukprot:CAMPEP_0204323724 /NCGR_PEP_ID=MMETSP0469-20131031/9648_1 /ASSEMBLY_ACC=CAM_ASM_000384 /TAXON_ID=2969 /ORGANISM="Oxyrrhis marina" /LENGTH=51 /DNA_ID=CAMNT_0051305241 /DNA_START=41 /DNA_END=193 /DNA_ORIENTATION=+
MKPSPQMAKFTHNPELQAENWHRHEHKKNNSRSAVNNVGPSGHLPMRAESG